MTGAPRTDYERIAARYDEDRELWDVPRDEVIAHALTAGTDRFVGVDLGCGTGTYLATQRGQFGDGRVRLIGMDPSFAMLGHAREKGLDRIVRARAESFPFVDASLDYVHTNCTFHHFEDKYAAVDEVARVLRRGGRFRMRNMDLWRMPRSWTYQYFPATFALDELRFWSEEQFRIELEARGFDVDVVREARTEPIPVAEVLVRAERRVVSQIAILDDAAYAEGLASLRTLVAREPNAIIESDWASLDVRATKLR